MKHPFIIGIVLVALLTLIIPDISHAQPNPDFLGAAGNEVDGTYTITMKKMEISTDGTTWVTLGETESTFPIASANIGTAIGSYVSNSSIPPGTYTYIRFTMNRQFTIKGRSSDQDAGAGELYYYTTTQNGSFGGFYFAGQATSWVSAPADYESVAFTLPDDATGGEGEVMVLTDTEAQITKDISSNPIVISAGINSTIVASFNTQTMIGFEDAGSGNYIYYPMPPEAVFTTE